MDSYINLYFMGSRWYDPALGRFISPDSIVPDAHNPLDWDRYSYVRNNPINYTDPTGHWPEWVDWIMGAGCQYADDMSLGLFSMVSGDLDYNESQAFQDGRQAGRIASTVAATVDEVGGAAVAGAAAAGVLTTAGGSLAAAPVTGGTSLVVGGVVVAGEVVVGAAGAATAVYGGAVIAKIKGDPLQGGSSKGGIFEQNNIRTTPHFLDRLKQWGISEKEAYNIYRNGDRFTDSQGGFIIYDSKKGLAIRVDNYDQGAVTIFEQKQKPRGWERGWLESE